MFLGALIGVLSSKVMATDNKAYVQINAGVAFAKPYRESGSIQFITCSPFGCVSIPDSFFRKETSDTGYAFGAAIGYRFADWFRLEVEGIYQSNDLNAVNTTVTVDSINSNLPRRTFKISTKLKGERERSAFLFNGYYDFRNSTPFTPYVTAGLGGYHLRIDGRSSGTTSNLSGGIEENGSNNMDFAWQVGAGAYYTFNDIVSIDLKYRYFSGSDADVKTTLSNPFGFRLTRTDKYEVGDHQVMAGLRFSF